MTTMNETVGAPESGTRDRRIYRKIMVPLDGTAFSEVALRPAGAMAVRMGAELHLVTVYGRVEGRLVTVDPVPAGPPRFEGPGELREYLAEVRKRLRRAFECETSMEVLDDAHTAGALVQHARSVKADLIIAATHSHSLFLRVLLGSTSVDLVREAPCPVLLVPARPAEPSSRTGLQGEMGRVAAALDLDPEGPDQVVLNHASACARLWDAELKVVHVIDPGSLPIAQPAARPAGAPTPGGVSAHVAPPLETRLEEIAGDLRGRGVRAEAQLLRGGRPADAMAVFAEKEDVDLVVVGHHDKNLLERLVLGSESERLAREARDIGVMICPFERVGDS